MNTIWQWLDAASQLSFSQPGMLWFGLAVLALVPMWKALSRAVANTFVHGHKIRSVAWPWYMCAALLVMAWLSFVVALAQPKISETVMQDEYQAREFIIGIDVSGSMSMADVEGPELAKRVRAWEQEVYNRHLQRREKFPELYPNPPEKPQEVKEGQEGQNLTRFALARYAAVQFLESRIKSSEEATKKGKQGDRAGMFAFDDEPYWSWPLSSDLRIVVRKVEWMLGRGEGGGTNFDGPNGEPPRIGAFQACINGFRKWGKPNVKTKVMILISDGDAGISENRHDELLAQMKGSAENGEGEIHVYALVCGAESQLTNSSTESVRRLIKAVNPNDPNQPEFQNAVIWAGSAQAMQDAFDLINRLETSTIQGEPVTRSQPVHHIFILIGALSAALFITACAVFRENF